MKRLGALALLALGCTSPLREPATVSGPGLPTATLRAGVAEVDITPAPGLSLFGHGPEGRVSRGYRGRLRCRVLYVADHDDDFAWAVCDLAAPSGLLHRRVAERTLAQLGLGADRLAISATHTHGGPAHYFGNESYSGLMSTRNPGFDERVLDWLAERIAQGVQLARHHAQSGAGARLSWHRGALQRGLSRNRSLGPHCANPSPLGQLPSTCKTPTESVLDEVDRRISVLRVEQAASPGGPFATVGLFAVLGMHPTAIPNTNVLYHADLFGIAARELESRFPGAKIAIANGIEGDVSPTLSEQSWSEAERLGHAIANDIWATSQSPALTTGTELERAYHELDLPPLEDFGGGLCRDGAMGNAMAGGAEDGRTIFWHLKQAREGARRATPEGCQGYKLSWSAGLTKGRWAFPRLAMFQVIRLGGATLVPLPYEITTSAGLWLRDKLESGGDNAVLVGLSNEYLQYVTTRREYDKQHYEGASVIYGPGSNDRFSREVVDLIKAPPRDVNYVRSFDFNPAPRVDRFVPLEPEPERFTVHEPAHAIDDPKSVTFEWRIPENIAHRGRETDIASGPLVEVQVQTSAGWVPALDAFGNALDDSGTLVWVEQDGPHLNQYIATVTPPSNVHGNLRFVVGRNRKLVSKPFRWP